jgi:NADH dehydrogenase FAD-containing subunit
LTLAMRRQRELTFVSVGAGYAGVEALGMLGHPPAVE